MCFQGWVSILERQGSHSFSVQGTHIHVFLGPKTFGDIFLVRSILSAHPWFDHSSKGVYRVTCFPDWWSSADWSMFSPTRLIIAIILVHWDCFCENFTFYNIGNFRLPSIFPPWQIPTMVGFCPWWLWWESVRWQNPTICNDEETFLVQFRLVDWVTALRALIGFFSSAQCVLWSVRCPFIFYDTVSDTIRRRGGYRGIFYGKSRI